MGIEIERKFLLANSDWRKYSGQGIEIRQGYLNSNKERTVRVRTKANQGFLTIKGKNVKTTRQEFEYEIPFEDALKLLELCEKPIIEKLRYEVIDNELVWEIDEFRGSNEGLIIAEVEIDDENQKINIPEWIDREVSNEVKYYNSNLIELPFKEW